MLWLKSGTIKRIEALEKRLSFLERQARLPVTTIRPSRFEAALRLNPDNEWPEDGSPNPVPQPYVSKQVQINERLTSFEYAVKAQLGQAALFALVGLLIGILATILFELVWYASILIGLAIGALSLSILLLDHRGLVRELAKGYTKTKQSPQELRVSIKHHNSKQNPNIEFLYLNGAIEHADVMIFAREVTNGKSLALHGWIGVGGWTRTKLDNFFAELEKMGYITPGRGNKPRSLNNKGKALFRALAG